MDNITTGPGRPLQALQDQEAYQKAGTRFSQPAKDTERAATLAYKPGDIISVKRSVGLRTP